MSGKGKNNYTNYKNGDIVLLDLGWNNYDREFAFIHPAIIIKNTYNKVFIVPCTSRAPRKNKEGEIFKEYIIGTIQDGFDKQTIIMLYEARFVDKNRIISKIGHVTPNFFNDLYNKLFEELFESKKYEITKLNEIIENTNIKINSE